MQLLQPVYPIQSVQCAQVHRCSSYSIYSDSSAYLFRPVRPPADQLRLAMTFVISSHRDGGDPAPLPTPTCFLSTIRASNRYFLHTTKLTCETEDVILISRLIWAQYSSASVSSRRITFTANFEDDCARTSSFTVAKLTPPTRFPSVCGVLKDWGFS